MPPPNEQSTIRINYIRVDYKRRIFQETYPGVITLGVGSIVDDILQLVRERDHALKALRMNDIKVYRLKEPLKRLPDQPSEVVQRSSRHSLKVKNKDEEAFDTFKGQIKTFGIHTDFLEIVPLHLEVFDHFKPCGGDISVVIYHPKLAEDYEDIDEVRVEDQIHKIEEHDTPKTARVHDLKQLTKTAPWDTAGRDQLDYVFMGYPYPHHAFHVALYDPILAQLAYKLEKLDVNESEGEEIFPDAESFRLPSAQFQFDVANHYNTESKRSDAAFVWIKKIFPDCTEQFRIESTKKKRTKAAPKTKTNKKTPSAELETSANSTGSTVSAIPDGAVCTSVETPAAGGTPVENPAADANEEPPTVVVQELPNSQTKILLAFIEIKKRFGDAVLQSAKCFGRHVLTLEESPIFDKTNFPTIILTVEGHYLCVAILVNNGATIIRELLRMHIYGKHPDSTTITYLERIASALKACSEQLSEYYRSLPEQTSLSLCDKVRFPQPTLYPSETTNSFSMDLKAALEYSEVFKRLRIKSFLRRDDEGSLNYVKKGERPSKRARIMRGLFIAEGLLQPDGTRVEVVIKFSPFYNTDAHKLLAAKHNAPKLYECRRVIGDTNMIVMDRVKGKQWSSMKREEMTDAMVEELKCVVKDLHEGGFVHGDLRGCNVMVDNEGKVKVIDFDWAAKGREGRYPKNINMKNVGREWHGEVRPGRVMTQEHDLYARDVLISKRKGLSEPSESTIDS